MKLKELLKSKSGVKGVTYGEYARDGRKKQVIIDCRWQSSLPGEKNKFFYINDNVSCKQAFVLACEYRRIREVEKFGRSDINPGKYDEFFKIAVREYKIKDADVNEVIALEIPKTNPIEVIDPLIGKVFFRRLYDNSLSKYKIDPDDPKYFKFKMEYSLTEFGPEYIPVLYSPEIIL